MSVVPVETEYGRKRWIDQSSSNKDYSCVEGFCPSFVTVHGGRLRKGKGIAGADEGFGDLPEPTLPSLHEPWGILVTGVGGTGVVTIGALLGIAANLERKGITVLDMAGLAQKGGPVWSHIRVAARPAPCHPHQHRGGERRHRLRHHRDRLRRNARQDADRRDAGGGQQRLLGDERLRAHLRGTGADGRSRPIPRSAVPARVDGGPD